MQDQTLAVTPNPPVARAIGLIWVALILYVVGVVLDAVNLASGNHSVDVAFVVIVTVAVWSFLIRKISEGENWPALFIWCSSCSGLYVSLPKLTSTIFQL
jgi:uncharacterized membrane protein